MDTTTLLAQIWGPIMLAIGAGFFFSRGFYMRVYSDLEKAPFAVVFFGMFAMAAGIIHVMIHTMWETLPQVLVTLFGWSLLLKGTICTIFPGFADKSGDWALAAKVVPFAGVGALALGAYLSWFAYLM